VPSGPEEEFKSSVAAENREYTVVYGKTRLGGARIVVVDRTSGEELHRHRVGLLKRLKGVFV
jgi:hypothetical protein